MKRIFTTLTVLAVTLTASAQKPPLDHSVYDGWKSISGPTIQDGGQWAKYTVAPQEGDNLLHLYNISTGKEWTADRVKGQATISADASKAVFTVAPFFQETREAKIKKKKKEEMPKDSLAVMDLASGAVAKFPTVKGVKIPTILGDYVAFQKDAKDCDTLIVLNIKTLSTDSIACVDKYAFSREGGLLAYTVKPGKKDSITTPGIYLYDPKTQVSTEILKGEKKSAFDSPQFSDEADKLVFFAQLDTADKDAEKHLDMYLYSAGSLTKLMEHKADALKEGWEIGQKARVEFHDGYLTFGTRPIPREKDTTLVEFEQAKLDIWVWNEDYIQPIQKKRLEKEKERTYLAKINYDGSGFVQLADEQIPEVRIGEFNNHKTILATSNKPYRIQTQWSYAACADIWLINLEDGSRKLIEKAAPYGMQSVSPDGRWAAAYNEKESAWYIFDCTTGEKRNVTDGLGVAFYNEEDDHPSLPGAYGPAQWADNSSYVWLKDRYDIWQIDPSGAKAPRKITDGRPSETVYTYESGVYNISGDKSRGQIKTGKPAYFKTFNRVSKKTGYARLDITKKNAKVENLAEGPYTYASISVSGGKKPVALYTRGNYEEGTNLWQTKDSFKTQTQLSDINPQQRDYNWGTVEMVHWKAADGTPADGLLFKPEDFDPEKKYPVMVYFYERYSDELYRAWTPAPSASTVNFPYFTSNGYLVFIPDIRYKDGHPGKSCMDYLMPGCDMLCEYPWVDGDNMAIQGQSWGGYQVAYIITRTGRFKAAGAGAPVSNMTSAYGGIRWESGVARTGQYEQGQSRIGKTLWDGFDLYVENSPLFHVPNVTTPVLIMHNDADGAVPWWQGIEFFNGLRRCGKQAWMLQYNDEAHNLKERRNRKDLSIRLSQFFDHFLKGAPAPVWMTRGVPATEKGTTFGLEYDETPEQVGGDGSRVSVGGDE